jgi:hypothetical protein
MLSFALHPELVDYPGFWVLAALFLAGAVVALYVAVRLIRKFLARGKGR